MKMKSLTLWLLLFIVLGHYHPLNAQQPQERVIRLISWPNEPLQISAIKVAGKSVELDQKFLADDNWLCEISVSLTNKSKMDIIYFYIDANIPPPRNSPDGVIIGFYDLWGPSPWFWASWEKEVAEWVELYMRGFHKPLKPGDTMTRTMDSGCGVKKFHRDADYPNSIKEIEIMVRDVAFNRDSVWRKGEMLRRDSTDPYKWLVIRK